ncbi:MAG: antibiotic biosynthesis monooxygenase [Sulfuritalea sp.]|nr:antibiotic biosynthesis monooxygenase [Sulfuritalea sp.]
MTELVFFVVHDNHADEFPAALARGAEYLRAAEGYRGHTLSRCIEQPNNFVLLVHWRSLADHTKRFRASLDYIQWREAITPFLVGAPDVRHIVAGEEPSYDNLLRHPLMRPHGMAQVQAGKTG